MEEASARTHGTGSRRARVRAALSRCEEALGELKLPKSFTVDELVAAVVAHRNGRKIVLRAIHLDGTIPYGVFVATTDMDLILYPKNTTALHRGHIIAHELAHIIFGHAGTTTAVSAAEYSHAVLDPIERLRQLVPGLTPGIIRRLLGRTDFTNQQEFTAELFAYLALAPRSQHAACHPIVPIGRGSTTLPKVLRSVFEVSAKDVEATCA